MAPTAELSLTLNSMGNSHKNLLFRNHWVNSNQTLVEWSLESPLPTCPVIPTFNQDGCQTRNRKGGDEIKNKCSLKLLSQSQPNFAEMIPSKIESGISDLRPRWLPQPNLI
jgi:hypothetical protein